MNFKVKKVFFNCSISCRCSSRFPHSSSICFFFSFCFVAFVRVAWTDIVWIVASAYFKKWLEFNLLCPKSLISRWNPFILTKAFTSGPPSLRFGNFFEWSVTFFVFSRMHLITCIWIAAVPKAYYNMYSTSYTHTPKTQAGEHPIRKCPVAETSFNYHVSNIAFPGTGRSNWQKVATRIQNHTVAFARTQCAYMRLFQTFRIRELLFRSLDVRATSYACMHIHEYTTFDCYLWCV